MAAGTAAALVPIRSITRLSDNKTSTYLPESMEDAGPVCLKLLTTLKGIQLGKIKDTFGWNSLVEEVDIKKYETGYQTNGVNGESVDELPWRHISFLQKKQILRWLHASGSSWLRGARRGGKQFLKSFWLKFYDQSEKGDFSRLSKYLRILKLSIFKSRHYLSQSLEFLN